MLISQAPLRISLLGGGSDLPAFIEHEDGAVLSFAINRRVYVIGHPFTHRDGILLKYSNTEDVGDPQSLKHPIAREVFMRYGIDNMDVAIMSDVPAGTGLGSSSSFTVACIAFSARVKGINRSPQQLAEEASEIEIDVLNEPIGYQDQWASAYGGVNILQFTSSSIECTPVNLSTETRQKLQNNLFLIPVGNPRSAGQVLLDQGRNYQTDSTRRNLTRDLVKLVPLGVNALQSNLGELGPLLNEAWLLKRQLSDRISNSEVEDLYAKGMSAGSTGGKLLGAGGSGYFAFYVPEENAARFNSVFPTRLSFEISDLGAGVIHDS
jgi:D-glycero-alpha-D-manno-heptose-7-phosphate kinase